MRIISGCRRGHKLLGFDGGDIRPTTDRVKESIFNMIREYVPGAAVWDMFAGSGALSLEAVSSGAAHAVLTDNDPRSVRLIRSNIGALGFCGSCEVRAMSCFDYAARRERQFDIIFLDPPYNRGFIEPALAAITENGLLTPGGIAVLESDDTDFRGEARDLEIDRQKKYGRTYITIYKRKQ